MANETSVSAGMWLEVLRKRREHLEKVFYQQESRAQFVSTLVVGIAASLLTAAGGNLRYVFSSLFVSVFLLLALTILLLTLFLSLTTFFPLVRTRFELLWLDGIARKIGFFHLGLDAKKYVLKPGSMAELGLFVRTVVVRGFDLECDGDRLWEAELYNLWAQWLVAERRAGLLRWSIVLLAVGLPLSGVAYFAVKSVVPDDPHAQAVSSVIVGDGRTSSLMPSGLASACGSVVVTMSSTTGAIGAVPTGSANLLVLPPASADAGALSVPMKSRDAGANP